LRPREERSPTVDQMIEAYEAAVRAKDVDAFLNL
jgi:ketosteroid isomerase-like protein